MSSFTLTDGGGMAMGQGIGNAVKAFALAGQARDSAALAAGVKRAQLDNYGASARKSGIEADILAEKLGLIRDPMKAVLLEQGVPLAKRGAIESYQQTGGMPADNMGPPEPPPIDPALLQRINKSLGLALNTNMTGSNVQQMANARGTNLMTDITQGVLDGSVDATRGAQARFAGQGGPAVFDNVGTTGYSQNAATGGMDLQSPELAAIFKAATEALANQRNTAATANTARAGASNATADAKRAGGGSGRGEYTYSQALDDARGKYKLQWIDGFGMEKKGAPSLDDFIATYLREQGFDPVTQKRAGSGNKNPESTPSAANNQPKSGAYASADDVKAAFDAGKISRDEAVSILRRDFGMK